MNEHVQSALYSFATGFLLFIVPAIGELSMEEIQSGALVGLLFAATRSGLKAVIPMLLELRKKNGV
jgi:hypothetical protein